MTSNYLDPIPPVDVDHIEYAIQRANVSVNRNMVKTEEDLRIVKARAVASTLYLTILRPVDPYATELDEDDPAQWKEVRRQFRRFTVAEVLKALLPNGLQVSSDFNEKTLADKKAIVINALLAQGNIGVVPEHVGIEIGGAGVTITSTKAHDLMWWGQGTVKFTAPIIP